MTSSQTFELLSHELNFVFQIIRLNDFLITESVPDAPRGEKMTKIVRQFLDYHNFSSDKAIKESPIDIIILGGHFQKLKNLLEFLQLKAILLVPSVFQSSRIRLGIDSNLSELGQFFFGIFRW
jgi:hypothetical protein